MGFRITCDKNEIDLDVVFNFLSTTYWSPRLRRDVFDASIANSFVLAALDEVTDRPVGFVRAVTDYATHAWVCDVYVAEEHRGQGIATAMLEALHARPEFKTLRRFCLATRFAQPLYLKLGYLPVKEGNWMERKLPDSNWQETPQQ
jgi:GNAT superfamily N-acetyltransferase